MHDFIKQVFIGKADIWGIDSGLLQNTATELVSLILGVVITVFFVNRLSRHNEKKRWIETELQALKRLQMLFSNFSWRTVGRNIETGAQKPGPKKQPKIIQADCKQLLSDIQNWASSNSLIFMLGGNREFSTLSQLTAKLQNAVLTIKRHAIENQNSDPATYDNAYNKPMYELVRHSADLITAMYRHQLEGAKLAKRFDDYEVKTHDAREILSIELTTDENKGVVSRLFVA